MPNILVNNNFYQGTAQACIVDLIPPTFAGLASASVQSRGQIRTSWLAGSDLSLPIRYEIYIQANTNVGLFNTANIVGITDKLQFDTWTTPDGQFLVNGTTYHLGVRAVDAVGNRDSNVISQSVISTGVFTSADVYNANGAFALTSSNQLQGTIWALKNSQLATSSNSVLGTASYQVFDRTGTAVLGMAQSGIVADANGQFKITPVASSLNQTLDHYMIRVTVQVDGAARTDYVPLIQPVPEYEIDGSFGLSESNQLVGTFWASADEQVITNPARLGTASYQIYDRNGSLVSGMSQSGIVADANGQFKITPVVSSLEADLTFYIARVTITVDGIARSEYLPILGKVPSYECFAHFSVNGLNQLIGFLWCEADGKVKKGAAVGTASYTVYDATGTPVPGLTQTGITANAEGRFLITPVSAALITDLTYFSVTLTIQVDGVVRESFHAFSPLGS
jgi:hypothetical protein